MKYMLFFLSFFSVSSAYALSCFFPDIEYIREKSPNVYLIEIKSILNMKEENCFVRGNAEIEVLKVYRGDAGKIQKINEVSFSEDGNYWPSECFFPTGFLVGEKIIVFSNSEEILQLHRGGDCNVEIDIVVNNNLMDEFEKEYKPVWIRQ